jgi:hypothetical protein
MKIYKIIVAHFAPKDNHTAIETFVLAVDDDDIYKWLDEEKMYGTWTYRNDEDGMCDIYNDEYEVIGQETYKEKMMRIKGEVHDEGLELSGLYYGRTLYGWEEMPSEMITIRAAALEGLGVLVDLTKPPCTNQE